MSGYGIAALDDFFGDPEQPDRSPEFRGYDAWKLATPPEYADAGATSEQVSARDAEKAEERESLRWCPAMPPHFTEEWKRIDLGRIRCRYSGPIFRRGKR